MIRTARLTVIGIVLHLVLLGCTTPPSAEPDQLRSTQAGRADTGVTNAEPTVSVTDYELIELVLVDVMDFDEFHPYAGHDGKRSQIVLDSTTCGSSGFLSDDQLNGEVSPDEDRPIPADISADLRRRNPKQAFSLSGFKPTNPKILVADLSDLNLVRWSDFENKFTDARGYVKVWVSGYSKDGNTAVVRASFGPTPHGATLTYMLVKKDGHWTVKWRKTAYYA